MLPWYTGCVLAITTRYPESSSEFQRHLHNWRAFTWSQSRQMTPSSTLCHQIPPPPKAQLLDGAIKHADIRLDSVHHAASGTRKVTARFYVPDSRVRASFVAKIAQGASTISFLSWLRGGGAHTPASPQGRAGPSAMPLQPSSSRMASFSRQLHHAAPRRNPTSAWPATAVPGGQALSTT